MATRLALAKAKAISTQHPGPVMIGSDQVAAADEDPMAAIMQTRQFPNGPPQLRGQRRDGCHFLYRAGATVRKSGFERFHVERFRAHFREIDDKSIENYLHLEEPYDCAAAVSNAKDWAFACSEASRGK